MFVIAVVVPLAMSLAVGGLTLALLIGLWSRLVSRVRSVHTAAAHWARGDWAYRSGLTSRDEFGQVASALDAMADERQRAEQALGETEERFRRAVQRGEEAQRQHVAYLDQIIAAQSELAQEELDDQRLMDRVVDRLRELTGADGAVVELLDGSEMVYAAGSGSAAAHVGFRLNAEGSFSGLCTRTGEVLLSRDTETDPRVDREATRKINVRSMVVAPLAYGGGVVGVLKVMSTQPNGFDEQQVATLELLAGVLGGALGHAQAFAERSRAEAGARAAAERLEAVLRAATEVAIIGVGLDGRIQLFNAGAERMLGYSAEEMTGRSPMVFQDEEEVRERAADRGMAPQEMFVGAARAGGATTDEWTYIRNDGSRLTVLLTITGLRDHAGALEGFIGIASDITERKAVERMKDQFVSMVSHELRTPLTSIRGSLGLLASGMVGPVPEKGQRMLDIAISNADRLVRLINDILDLERMQSGRMHMQRGDTNLGPLMTQATDVMRAMAEGAGVRLEVEPLSATLSADPDRLIQVLTNLLSNAIKFSPRDGRVCLQAFPCGDGRLRIEVRDEGRGIPADKLESIFERFQQVDVSDSRVKGGTGLGLAICRTIVEQHGGRIWAESALDQGTTMVVEIPMAQRARAA